MTIYSDLYGFRLNNLHELAKRLEEIFDTKFDLGESLWVGPYYIAGDPFEGEENLYLKGNYVDFEEEWTEPQFKEFPIVFYVNRTQRAIEIETLIKSILKDDVVLLRREEEDVTS
jgi:hypothetical protein